MRKNSVGDTIPLFHKIADLLMIVLNLYPNLMNNWDVKHQENKQTNKQTNI